MIPSRATSGVVFHAIQLQHMFYLKCLPLFYDFRRCYVPTTATTR